MEVREGGIVLEVPALSTDGAGEHVFYNPRQERNRDVTIAALRAYLDRNPAASTYLDATTASGVRGIRAASDGWEVTCCDRDPDATDLCGENFARNGLEGDIHTRNVNALLHEQSFDVVDIDPFGSPMPFADAAIQGTRRLLCVTATDTAPLCGAHFRAGIRRYGAVARPTEYHREIGLRVLLSALCRTAARHDVAARPLLSHVEGHSVRTYLELSRGAQPADAAIDELGTLWHCPECLHREAERGLIPVRRDRCPICEHTDVLAAGPLWLARPHDPDFVESVATGLDDDMSTVSSARRMLERIRGELDRPTHFDQHTLCKRWSVSAPPMEDFLAAIGAAGFDASRAHYDGTAFKTEASVADIQEATLKLTSTL